MLMRQFYCEVIPKHSMDENEIRTAEAWVADNGDYDAIVDDIRQLAWQFGYELVEGAEITGMNACMDMDPNYLDDRFGFVE